MIAFTRFRPLFVLVCVVAIAGACQTESPNPDATARTFGNSVAEPSARPASEVASAPSALEGSTVTVAGRISTVCQKKGCWLALDTGTAVPIRVLVPRTDEGYAFTVPTTLTGRATVTGTLRIATLDADTRKHLTEDGAASARAREVQIVATGIRVRPGA